MQRRMFLAVFILALPVASIAADMDSLQQMIQRLEQRIERLESHAGIVSAKDEASRSEVIQAEALQKSTGDRKDNRSARVKTRYWLSQQSEFDSTEPPLREGRMSLTMPVSLKPQNYGYSSSGMFDKHKDPSLYPLAALIIDAELKLPQTADYLLVVKSTPPREVGGAGNVQVSIELRIGGELVYQMPYSKSLASRQHRLHLQGGIQSMELRIFARSPGFGPSQTGTRVYLGLQAEGEISPSSISAYLHE
ncbi:MAG: hypothetical protein OQK98_09630 [Gammaproteobacteria bacterium]|nr:hypothetical protein [Gammaproteobacteria bacterium]